MKSAITKTSFPLALLTAVAMSSLAVGAPASQPGAATPQFTPTFPRPDLVIRVTWLQAPVRIVRIKTVPVGKSYKACFKIANIGPGASGPYRLGAGGLGIPTSPYMDFPGLAPGAAQNGCILYPTTPPVGSYNLGMTVDSLGAVAELREDNNSAVLHVEVTP